MPTVVELEESAKRGLRIIELQNREIKAKLEIIDAKLDKILGDVQDTEVLTTKFELGTPVKQIK